MFWQASFGLIWFWALRAKKHFRFRVYTWFVLFQISWIAEDSITVTTMEFLSLAVSNLMFFKIFVCFERFVANFTWIGWRCIVSQFVILEVVFPCKRFFAIIAKKWALSCVGLLVIFKSRWKGKGSKTHVTKEALARYAQLCRGPSIRSTWSHCKDIFLHGKGFRPVCLKLNMCLFR